MEDKAFLKQVGLRLKCQRIMAEVSTKEASKRTGLHIVTINKMENGATDFCILSLKRLMTAYGKDIKEVL